jgi:hypothetical protein
MKSRVDNNVLIESYSRLKSVWLVGKEVGLSGQNVWERLQKLNINTSRKISEKTFQEIKMAYKNKKRGSLNLNKLSEKTGMLTSNLAREARKMGLTDRHRKFSQELCFDQARRLVDKVKNGLSKPWGQKKHTKKEWMTLDGKTHYFKSSWEIAYVKFLNFLKEKKAIIDWEYEPKTFWFLNVLRGVRSYTPDFKVTTLDGNHVWHEVKGFMDQRSKTKIKRMKKYYPQEKLIIIDGKQLKKLGLI